MSYPYRYAPGAEVSGAIMSAVFNHYTRNDVIESLERHGLDYFDAENWYPVEQFISLLEEWSEMPAFTTNFVSVGMAMIYHIDLPDDFDKKNPVDKLFLIGELHLSHHRGEAGTYVVKQTGPSTIQFKENTVWPDDLIYGYIYGAAQRFLPQYVHFTLRYAAGHQHQENGGETTLFELTWE